MIATLLYRKRAREHNDRRYSRSADEFEHLAVQILNKFYSINPSACLKAIVRSIAAYGNITCLELAVEAKATEFIAQRAVQKVLSNIWLVAKSIFLEYSPEMIFLNKVRQHRSTSFEFDRDFCYDYVLVQRFSSLQ